MKAIFGFLQLQLLDAISALPVTNEIAVSISQLNSGLIDISQLYSDFAEPYQLWECQLAILHCAGHPDQVGLLLSTLKFVRWRDAQNLPLRYQK